MTAGGKHVYLHIQMNEDDLNNAAAEVAAECLAVRLRLLNRHISRLYDERLRPLGLKISQMNILVAVQRLGTAAPADICRALSLETSTLSRNVKLMAVKGWVEAVPGEDGRERPLRLTAAGRALLAAAVPLWRQAQDEAKGVLGGDADRVLEGLAEGVRQQG